MQSRREFLSGAGGAALGTALPRGAVEMLLADTALLAELWPDELELVLELQAAYPAISLAEAIEMLRAAGM
jgi:hypothetical protein